MTSVYEVEMIKNSNLLIEKYSALFADRYGARPHITEKDMEVMRWVVQAFKFSRAMELIQHYLKMDTDWFVQNSHAIYYFKRNINQVIADLGQKKKTSTASKNTTEYLKQYDEIPKADPKKVKKMIDKFLGRNRTE